jgi:capsular exopolysaccharide synthesis family protein
VSNDTACATPIDGHLISLVAPASYEADRYRVLRHIVERLRAESALQVLAVTSAIPGEGKTVTTLNLAGALAQAPGARVLVMDADLRRPTVAKYLALDADRSPGLVEAITDPAQSLDSTVRRLESANLSVLLAGQPNGAVYEMFSGPRFERLIAEARRRYDYVLIDTPPVVPVPDCREIGKCADGLLVVVAAHKTRRTQLAEAFSLLESDKVVGLVFNGLEPSGTTGYGYGYYYTDRRSRH